MKAVEKLSYKGTRAMFNSMPTPPSSPRGDGNRDAGTKSNSRQSQTKDVLYRRAKDPIGQLVDSLCKTPKHVLYEDSSAFSPIITSSCKMHLTPCTDEHTTQFSNHIMFYSPIMAQYFRKEAFSPIAIHQQHSLVQIPRPCPSTHAPTVCPNVLREAHLSYNMSAYFEQMKAQRTGGYLQAFGFQNSNFDSPAISNMTDTSTLPPWMNWFKSDNTSGMMAKEPRPNQPPRYQCDSCRKSYSTFGGLSKHKQFHCTSNIKKEFNCKYCDKSYSSLGALKMHIRTHTLPCKCKICGKAFSRPWLLQGHIRTHTGEKPFRCTHCARAFADRSNLRAHLQTHSEVKKYGCKHCTKTFSRMSLLLKHMDGSCVGLRR
ncbi:hypothetical protein CHS0354_042836 [Potamilus streckersoni]|uniref:C2H2-type domain-containing protein n=1 Tax=Potamilus streckersoni TaxID=2493646 RepID=A0AAE0T4S9_9BIVA|nr:hypothetical protein CHS0354_042836 [Potamilus streckersoni]